MDRMYGTRSLGEPCFIQEPGTALRASNSGLLLFGRDAEIPLQWEAGNPRIRWPTAALGVCEKQQSVVVRVGTK